MKEVYFTAWLFSKPQVLRWPVARAAAIAVIRFLTIGLAFNARHCQILWNPDQNVF
jgi:hypothetical protein